MTVLTREALMACAAVLVLGGCGTEDIALNTQASAMETTGEEMLRLINQARSVSRFCGETQYQAVPDVAWNDRLVSAAQRHSDDMARNDFFSHTGSDGSSAGERMIAAGYDWMAYNENIGAGYPSVSSVVQGWLNSPGHCKNIMSARISEIGAAYAERSESSYGIYWTFVGGSSAD